MDNIGLVLPGKEGWALKDTEREYFSQTGKREKVYKSLNE
jgi:hypothetical protein